MQAIGVDFPPDYENLSLMITFAKLRRTCLLHGAHNFPMDKQNRFYSKNKMGMIPGKAQKH